jgi:hypothetical protein
MIRIVAGTTAYPRKKRPKRKPAMPLAIISKTKIDPRLCVSDVQGTDIVAFLPQKCLKDTTFSLRRLVDWYACHFAEAESGAVSWNILSHLLTSYRGLWPHWSISLREGARRDYAACPVSFSPCCASAVTPGTPRSMWGSDLAGGVRK